jgi:general secretion pathway protein B
MSYILEGLKKLERKRRREESPKGYIFSQEEEVSPARKRPLWPLVVLAAALFANAAVLVWWYFPLKPPLHPPQRETPSFRTARPVRPEPISPAFPSPAATEKPQKRSPAPVGKDDGRTQTAPSVSTPPVSAPEKVVPVGDGTLWKIQDLPTEVRQKLPALKMSLHYYSPVPVERFVVINQRNLREGDSLGEDLKVAEINPQGVILRFKHHRILLGIHEGP